MEKMLDKLGKMIDGNINKLSDKEMPRLSGEISSLQAELRQLESNYGKCGDLLGKMRKIQKILSE